LAARSVGCASRTPPPRSRRSRLYVRVLNYSWLLMAWLQVRSAPRGILSHPAIIAREHGIPAVVGTGNATAVLKDGQRVTVDGNAGVVDLADGAHREPGGVATSRQAEAVVPS
jgi:PEP-utilising enzyme, mobile domain